MSSPIDKETRRAERERLAEARRRAEARSRLAHRVSYAAVPAIAATLIGLAVVLGGGDGVRPTAPGAPGAVGAPAPAFVLTDVVSGGPVSSESLRGRRTMLFFSEGVTCQACMVQAAELERAPELRRAGIDLISVTTDRVDDLADAARQYRITKPLLADPTTAMSSAYGMLGHGGMGHPDTAGHAFMLVDEQGIVRWHRAYQEMYVETDRLLRDLRVDTAA